MQNGTLQHPSFEIPSSPQYRRSSRPGFSTAAVVGAFLFLLIGIAGVLTAVQLSQTTVDNRSQAALEFSTFSLVPTKTQLKPNEAISVAVRVRPNGNPITAVVIPITFDPAKITVSDLTVISSALPTTLQAPSIDANTGKASFIAGVSKIVNEQNVGVPLTAETTIATFTVTSKTTTGQTQLSFDTDKLKAAAVGSEGNVAQSDNPVTLTIATAEASCNQTCTLDSECTNSQYDFTCHSGNCRLRSNPTSPSCSAQTECQATPSQPGNGAEISRDTPLVWSACAQAVAYEVTVTGQDVNWVSTPLSNKQVTVPAEITLVPGRTYTWKVRACLNADCSSAGAWSDTRTFVLAQPPQNTNSPKLKLDFELQGLSKAGVSLPVDLTIVYKKPGSTTDTKVTRTVDFTSISTGRMTTAAAIDLTEISLTASETVTDAVVYARTPTSLVTKVGMVNLQGGVTSTLSGTKFLPVGDFVRDGNNANVIKINDIALPLRYYTDLSVPVTDTIREFDINYDGKLSLLDIAIVISNFQQLEYRGENP